ncbi:uncharacterized protein LOC131958055 [Physella acuta]|uniref:uncharacterized protein LOC131958055 n=1 Tax=Physella acuta TaxID=109671 RepID=UPI0027DB7FEC|nr:uncharacterized protein LOC131958055 [Physella acuta]
MDETKLRQMAVMARGDQGYHETEVTISGEADLHRAFVFCDKNPGHKKFISVKKFSVSDLPQEYQDEDIVKYILAQAELTVRIRSTYTSPGRPEGYAFHRHAGKDLQRYGTGFVQYVYRNDVRSGKPCPCPECKASSDPLEEWAKVKVRTATHVVFDDDEARNSVAELFYDAEDEKDKIKSVYGDNVRFGALQGDWCDMRCVTHDMELVEHLKDTWGRWRWLETKINQKYSDDDQARLAVVVSHPHGCDKQVSVGTWRDRQVVDRSREFENCVYTYDTPTCPGSSGAPVWILGKMKWGGFFGRHPHSGWTGSGLQTQGSNVMGLNVTGSSASRVNVSAVGWDKRI